MEFLGVRPYLPSFLLLAGHSVSGAQLDYLNQIRERRTIRDSLIFGFEIPEDSGWLFNQISREVIPSRMAYLVSSATLWRFNLCMIC